MSFLNMSGFNATPWRGEALLQLLELDALGDDVFQNRCNQSNFSGAIFGGQVLAQSLLAAIRTVAEDRLPNSAHAYFVRAGAPKEAVMFSVARLRDGRSFSLRRITASQGGRIIMEMQASFHVPEQGEGHEDAPPSPIAPPADLLDLTQLAGSLSGTISERVRQRLTAHKAIELRPVDRNMLMAPAGESGRQLYWVRAVTVTTHDKRLHACALLYLSDFWLIAAALKRHGVLPSLEKLQLASIDHSIWFHRPATADEWHLYYTESPWAGTGRGMLRGKLYSADGRLVASVAQEALIRDS